MGTYKQGPNNSWEWGRSHWRTNLQLIPEVWGEICLRERRVAPKGKRVTDQVIIAYVKDTPDPEGKKPVGANSMSSPVLHILFVSLDLILITTR